MKKGLLMVIGLVLAFLVASCGGEPGGDSSSSSSSGSTLSTKNVPNKFAPEVPNSMKMKNGVRMKDIGSVKGGVHPLSTYSADGYAYNELRNTIKDMQNQIQSIAMNFVQVDTSIEGLSPSANTVSDKSVTITKELVDLIFSLMPADYLEFMDAETSNMMYSMVGQSMPLDPFVYNTTNDSTYNLYFKDEYMFLLWNTDKTKVKVIYDYIYSEGTMTSTNSTVFVYDDTTKNAKMVYISSFTDTGVGMSDTYYYEVSMKEKADSTKNGIFLSYKSKFSFSGTTYAYEAEGFADDDGGYITSKSTYKDGNQSPPLMFTFMYREGFNGQGYMTYIGYSEDGNTWYQYDSEGNPTLDSTGYDGEYASYYSEYDTYAGEIGDTSGMEDIYAMGGSTYVTTSGLVTGGEYWIFNSIVTPEDIEDIRTNSSPSTAMLDKVWTNFLGTGYAESTTSLRLDLWVTVNTGTALNIYKYDWETTYNITTNKIEVTMP